MLTKDQLYWGGFLAADGCVDESHRIRVYLHIKDIEQLEKFKRFSNKPHKIQTSEAYPDRCAFEYTDRLSCEYLEKNFNIVPRKSLIYQVPTWMNDEEFAHYLRGYFDGDGCICESFSNKSSVTATLYATITGSNDAIDYIADRLFVILGITGTVQRRAKYSKTGNPYSTVKYSTRKATLLLKYLYEHSDPENRLDRKYSLYDSIVVKGNRLTR